MSFEIRTILIAAGLLCGGGAGLAWLEPVPVETRGAGVEAVVARLGSGRVLAADWQWLQANLAWERRDEAAVRQRIGWAAACDPETPYFWINGARVLAFDLPAWRAESEPGAPAAVRLQVRRAGAEEALRWLERGQRWHEGRAALEMEMGAIRLQALGDRAGAAEHFRRAAACADAPAAAARLARVLGAP